MWLAYCLRYTFSFTSLVLRCSNNGWGARGIHCSHTRTSPGFSGEPGNFCDNSLCFTTIHYWITGVGTSRCSSVCSEKPRCVPSIRLESQEWHWRTTTEDLKWHGCACMATNRWQKKLPFAQRKENGPPSSNKGLSTAKPRSNYAISAKHWNQGISLSHPLFQE